MVFKFTKKRLENIFDSTLAGIFTWAISGFLILLFVWASYLFFSDSNETPKSRDTAESSLEVLSEEQKPEIGNEREGDSSKLDETDEKTKLKEKTSQDQTPQLTEPNVDDEINTLSQAEAFEKVEPDQNTALDQTPEISQTEENLNDSIPQPSETETNSDEFTANAIIDTSLEDEISLVEGSEDLGGKTGEENFQTNEESIDQEITYTDYEYVFSEFRTLNFKEKRNVSSIKVKSGLRTAIFWDFTINIEKSLNDNPGRCRLEMQFERLSLSNSFFIIENGSNQEWFEWGDSNQITLTINSLFGTNVTSGYIKQNLFKHPPTFRALCEGDTNKVSKFHKVDIFF